MKKLMVGLLFVASLSSLASQEKIFEAAIDNLESEGLECLYSETKFNAACWASTDSCRMIRIFSCKDENGDLKATVKKLFKAKVLDRNAPLGELKEVRTIRND